MLLISAPNSATLPAMIFLREQQPLPPGQWTHQPKNTPQQGKTPVFNA
jgi:hypothetical protein